jgi:hypothetical protein
MIVDKHQIVRCVIFPPKDESPLLIDADAIVPGKLATQGLQSIARRGQQILQSGCSADNVHLAQCGAYNVGWEAARTVGCSTMVQVLSRPIAK